MENTTGKTVLWECAYEKPCEFRPIGEKQLQGFPKGCTTSRELYCKEYDMLCSDKCPLAKASIAPNTTEEPDKRIDQLINKILA